MENGLYGIVVISGEGVKAYYEKKGYKEVDTFMVKDFWTIYVMFYYYKRVILDTSYSYYNSLVMTMLILYYSVHLCFMAFVYVLFAGLLIVFAHILY
jgi:hypothetical protein